MFAKVTIYLSLMTNNFSKKIVGINYNKFNIGWHKKIYSLKWDCNENKNFGLTIF